MESSKECLLFSILFADLVNFTDLTTKCSAKDLVSMLNEIYGRFDGISRVGSKDKQRLTLT